jgi:hypothetical protein
MTQRLLISLSHTRSLIPAYLFAIDSALLTRQIRDLLLSCYSLFILVSPRNHLLIPLLHCIILISRAVVALLFMHVMHLDFSSLL